MSQNTTEAVRLLVVSREPSILRPLWSIGECNSWQLETAGDGWEALERLESGAMPNVLLLELPGGRDGLHLLRWLRRLRPELPIILLSQPEDLIREKEVIRLGAQDLLVRPFEERQLESAIRRNLAQSDNPRTVITSDNVEQLGTDTFFVCASPAMQKVRAQAELLAQADVPALVVGEGGSGRDTTALLIHKLSLRSGSRFLKVNCAALPSHLLDKELFGHYGDQSRYADRSVAGKLELCNGGTIFLDDVAEMPISLQEQLIHVLHEKRFFKSETGSYTDLDVRVLAAADISIERALSEKKLREDFYYRLSAFTVHVPPLRQRKDEIPLLLQHFMHRLSRHYAYTAREFSPAVLDACQQYSWPGNVRELENFVKRYLMIGDQGASFAGFNNPTSCSNEPHFRNVMLNSQLSEEFDQSSSENKSLKSLVHDVKSSAERNAITAALEKTGWNRKAAARLLQISYRTMLYKIEQYHMKDFGTYTSTFLTGGYRSGHGMKHNGKPS